MVVEITAGAEGAKILVVEDEANLAFSLKLNLEAEGYKVILAEDGQRALDLFEQEGPFSLIILDVMLPEVDGFNVTRRLRSQNSHVGILMLTAIASEYGCINGLEAGVDDYLTKPFNLKELLLRVKRMVTRASMTDQSESRSAVVLTLGPFALNRDTMELRCPKGTYTLTSLEADVFSEFMQNPNRLLSRNHLLDKVWGIKGHQETRTVDNFIVRLRRYLEDDPGRPKYLTSVRGKGYRLVYPS